MIGPRRANQQSLENYSQHAKLYGRLANVIKSIFTSQFHFYQDDKKAEVEKNLTMILHDGTSGKYFPPSISEDEYSTTICDNGFRKQTNKQKNKKKETSPHPVTYCL